MIRCRLKEKVGFHIRNESGQRVKYLPGNIMEVVNIKDLGGAADKFEILDPVPEKNPIELDEPSTTLKMKHRGGGRYNVINTETDEPINENYLTKKEAEEMVGEPEITKEKKPKRRRKIKDVESAETLE